MLTFVENLGKCQASVYYAPPEVIFKVSDREEIKLTNVYLLKSYSSFVAAYSVEEGTLVLLPRFNYSTTMKRQVLKWLKKDFPNRYVYSMYDNVIKTFYVVDNCTSVIAKGFSLDGKCFKAY